MTCSSSSSSSSSSSPFWKRRHDNSEKKTMVGDRRGENKLGWMLFITFLGPMGLLAGLRVDGGYPRVVGAGEFRYSGGGGRQPVLREPMLRRLEGLEASLAGTADASAPMGPSAPPAAASGRVYSAVSYGADPTGNTDSTQALKKAIEDAFRRPSDRDLMSGIADLGGLELFLDGGTYLINAPLTLPAAGGGNFKIHGGSLRASDVFPTDRYLIELWASPDSQTASLNGDNSTANEAAATASLSYEYEYITLRDLLLDCNFRGGGIAVVNSLRTTINNCYITHFATTGIWVKDGHETYISTSYFGQHITAGNDPGEKDFSGTAISLMGNDNAVTDVVIFSAAIGVLVTGQANSLSNVHCYNKATGWGGTGIYLKLPGLTQTRIVNCYLDFTSIVSEDPVQLHVSSSFFLGGANIVLKSVNGMMSGVNIVDNMFSGSGDGVDIVQLDGAFKSIDQVVVDRNNVDGMRLRSTVAKGSVSGNGTSWTVDFSPVLLFPNRIEHVQYTMWADTSFPNHALRDVSGNRIVIESDRPLSASVFVSVDQSVRSTS